ncbi:pentatricopeptide repeat-containing protein [Trifolium pratense]|uniref:Pentatricopeptide repeat-containing protein n=1 Tax=Trifolium pratense TaxID=57577 RepID=A0A2K3L1N0_TRIPR|nr:pentatricopeptide repeat-containing protein [Trifolium pratense]
MSEPWLRIEDGLWMKSPQLQGVSLGQEEWQWLWKENARPKTKHLLWRICKGCLPTRLRLQERCVSCPLICPTCEHCNEDDLHALFHCNDSLVARQTAVQLTRNSSTAHRSHQQQFATQWLKPRQGWHKCNVDAAFHSRMVYTRSYRKVCDGRNLMGTRKLLYNRGRSNCFADSYEGGDA